MVLGLLVKTFCSGLEFSAQRLALAHGVMYHQCPNGLRARFLLSPLGLGTPGVWLVLAAELLS